MTPRADDNAQVFGVVANLHRLKIGDISADSVRKLGTSHIPMLNPMALLVMRGHARNTSDSRKGTRHNGQKLAQRNGGKSEVVSVRTGASLQKARATRFWREDRGQWPSEDRVESHGEQIAAGKDSPAILLSSLRTAPEQRWHARHL